MMPFMMTLVTIHDAILTNLWIKEYEPSLKRVVSQKSDLVLDQNGVCPQCQKMVTYLKKKKSSTHSLLQLVIRILLLFFDTIW